MHGKEWQFTFHICINKIGNKNVNNINVVVLVNDSYFELHFSFFKINGRIIEEITLYKKGKIWFKLSPKILFGDIAILLFFGIK